MVKNMAVSNPSFIHTLCNNLPATYLVLQNLVIQENTPGRDGAEYVVRVEVSSQQLKGNKKIEPYIQPFLFYNGTSQWSLGTLVWAILSQKLA